MKRLFSFLRNPIENPKIQNPKKIKERKDWGWSVLVVGHLSPFLGSFWIEANFQFLIVLSATHFFISFVQCVWYVYICNFRGRFSLCLYCYVFWNFDSIVCLIVVYFYLWGCMSYVNHVKVITQSQTDCHTIVKISNKLGCWISCGAMHVA